MKLKSLLFGSAAAFATVTGAQAADLPIAEPVEYVRICDAFGSGYYYIPGTETCLKISGMVRAEMHYVFEGHDDDDGDYFGTSDDDFNHFTTRARGEVNFDARTQTDLGVLRSYIKMRGTFGPEDFVEDAPYDSARVGLVLAYIQLLMDGGTFTAGRADSFFDFGAGEAFASRFGDDDPTTETNLFAYTFAFGNGFSATLSLEDPLSSGRRDTSEDFYDIDGQVFPDLVANVRIDQGWGSAQIMGAVGQIQNGEDDGDDHHDGDELGWAAGVGFAFEIPNTMFEIAATAAYADGLVSYVTAQHANFESWDGDTATAWGIRGHIKAGVTDNAYIALSGYYSQFEAHEDGEWDKWESEYWAVALTGGVDVAPGLFVGAEIGYANYEERELDYPSFDVDEEDEGSVLHTTFRVQRNF